MYPTLLSWGELRFHSYTVMMTLAFLIGTLGPIWLNKRRGYPYPISPIGGIWVFFAGIGGSRIYWMVQYGKWDDLRWLQFFFTGGLVFFGGLIGGIIGLIAYLKFIKSPVLPVFDMAAPFIAVAHGIGRIGCFLNGCCWGSLMRGNWPWGIRYPQATHGPYRNQIVEGLISRQDAYSLPIHPTQMYETVGLFIIFMVLLLIYKKHLRHGIVVLSYITLYGGLRFVTEAFRGESERHLYGFTTSQMVGLGMFCGGLLLFLLLKQTLWKGAPPVDSGPSDSAPADGAATLLPEEPASAPSTAES